ncbi:MAG: 4Fe-4S dicluster domain-containing protein [Anaerolineales bacterium]|nr:4Fe-4S dicluster domain-containing protein [Anaerolineales bacterium]
MLTTAEKVLFLVASLVILVFVTIEIRRIVKTIGRGHGHPDWYLIPGRIVDVTREVVSLAPVFRTRFLTSFFHALVAWGFIYYLLVNLGDLLSGYIRDFAFLGEGLIGNLFRLGTDIFSVLILLGMLLLLVRRFIAQPSSLEIRGGTLVYPHARWGIKRDSLIVGIFILIHVGARFLGESFQLALEGTDPWQPAASWTSTLWSGMSVEAINFGIHLGWWLSLGGILLFMPYFLFSKHLHIFMAPINYLLQPERRSMGELETLNFEDQTIEQYGAERLEHLSWSFIMDAYACIMCNRCQDACPAYVTGKTLSPAAMEINQRYFLNREGGRLASGRESSQTLTEFAISPDAVWACTACGACVQICPVGNEPMQDIMEIRRHLVLMENVFPDQLQQAYRGMERTGNPWNVPPEERLTWAQGLHVPTITDIPSPEILWWVGCAPSTDPGARKTACAFANILAAAGVEFAVLGIQERCTGDSARRSGNEYLFYELASNNIEVLNEVKPKRIVTTCPHCMHTLQNEYPAFGGHYDVIHSTQLIRELIDEGRLSIDSIGGTKFVTYHDPCYLGRQNGVINEPRSVLQNSEWNILEMPRSRDDSFCCGAGGGQMWKEEEDGDERVSMNRLREAEGTGAAELAVGCPFCMIMMQDAANVIGSDIRIRDIVEIVADQVRTMD